MDTRHENWAAGDAYQYFMGRWSAAVASLFVNWLDLPSHGAWLDVGCGTGALTQAIMASGRPRFIAGLDPSLSFIHYARRQNKGPSFVVGGGGQLPFSDQSFDAIVSGLALNFIPHPEQAVVDMQRAVKAGGRVAAYVWDYAGEMEFLRYFWDAAVELDAGASAWHEGQRFPLCQPDRLSQLWQSAGLEHVVVEALDIATVFDSFESYWEPFTVGNFPAPQYLLSLSIIQQGNLRDYLQSTIPTAADGSIRLKARVWAIRGSRPVVL